jgi:hypothetical protein
MRVERAMMAADVTVGLTSNRGTGASPTAGVPMQAAGKAEPAAAGQPAQAAAPSPDKAPVMPGLSASDRAAIATATGFYIHATGKVTPEGMPPWGYIVRYIEQRQTENSGGDAGVEAVKGASPAAPGDHVDVTV